MQKILFTTALALGLAEAATDTQGVTIAFNKDLKCGRCIDGGFNYCVNNLKDNGGTVTSYPSGECYDNMNNAQMGYGNDWLCSAAYVNPIYGKNVCPFNTQYCGATRKVEFTAAGQNQSLTINKMDMGQVCMYQVKSTCGAVSMMFNATEGKLAAEYVAFDTASIKLDYPFKLANTGTNSRDLKTFAPASGLPNRNATFGFMLAQWEMMSMMMRTENRTMMAKSAQMKAIDDRIVAKMQGLNATWVTAGKGDMFVNPMFKAGAAVMMAARTKMMAALNGGQGRLPSTSANLTKNAAGNPVLETIKPGKNGAIGLNGNMNCGNRTIYMAFTAETNDVRANISLMNMEVTAPSVMTTVQNKTNAFTIAVSAFVGAATLLWF